MSINFKVPIPSSTADITSSWITQVTGIACAPDSISIQGDIQEGIGFLSSICRVCFKSPNNQTHSIIVKLLPTNPKWLEFALVDCSDQREIEFYSIVLPDLLEVVPSLQENVCVYYNGAVHPANENEGTPRASMLVIEDLKAKGFEMMDFSGDGTEYVTHNLVVFLARLHYAARAISVKRGKPLPELYPFMQGVSDLQQIRWKEQMEGLCEDGFNQLEHLLKSQNIDKSVWERYKKLKPFMSEIVDKIENSGKVDPCLIHGDIWPPNIQVHEKLPVKVLDWQLLGYRDVAFDLSIMLYTVLPQDKLNNENLRKLLKIYWEEFEKMCKEGEYADKITGRRTWEQLEEFFFTWGAAFGFMVFLPSIECYGKDFAKFANVLRVVCEENNLTEFLLKVCNRK